MQVGVVEVDERSRERVQFSPSYIQTVRVAGLRQDDLAVSIPDRPTGQRPRSWPASHSPIQVVPTAMARTVDRAIFHFIDIAASVGTDAGEPSEIVWRRLGDHDLEPRKDPPAINWNIRRGAQHSAGRARPGPATWMICGSAPCAAAETSRHSECGGSDPGERRAAVHRVAVADIIGAHRDSSRAARFTPPNHASHLSKWRPGTASGDHAA
jgi:hypothetical protein